LLHSFKQIENWEHIYFRKTKGKKGDGDKVETSHYRNVITIFVVETSG